MNAYRDDKNSLKEAYLKEDGDYWYTKALLLGAKPTALFALKTEEWDKKARVMEWLDKVEKALKSIKVD